MDKYLESRWVTGQAEQSHDPYNIEHFTDVILKLQLIEGL